ncbi:MAG: universal stress protein [Myxococcales bacterium]|nr:MAG: universal stress protein [Myxococcales bacterium]
MSTSTPPALPTRFVVGVDFTQTSENALVEAIRLAKRYEHGELHVTHVLAVPTGSAEAKQSDAMLAHIEAATKQLQALVLDKSNEFFPTSDWEQDTVIHVRIGDAAKQLHQVAVDIDADYLVVGSHSRTGISKLILGSVAEELARIAHLPVLIAHPKELKGIDRTPTVQAARPGSSSQLHLTNSVRLKLRLGSRPQHISGLV